MEENQLQIVPASYKNVEAQYVKMMVPLYSFGCERKIKKALSNLKGIYSVNVDYTLQKVTVWGICNKYDILSMTRSKRKEARFWDSEEDQTINKQDIDEQSPNIPIDHDDRSIKRSASMIIRPPLIRTLGRSLSWKAIRKMVRMKSFRSELHIF